MKQHKQTLIVLAAFVLFALGGIANANWQGDLVKAGIDTLQGWMKITKGVQWSASLIVDYNTTTTARTITARETGTVFIMTSTSDDPVTFNLPDAAAGLNYTFIDLDATAAADLTINPKDGDSINLGTAGVSFNATGDAVGETVTLMAEDSVKWISTSKGGTWGAGS